MRKLAKVVKIDSIKNHPNADRLDIAYVGGWQSVVSRDQFKEGDLAVYFEVDSWIPQTVAPFLIKPDQVVKEFNGVKGVKLRTVQLRGELSQGLLMSMSVLSDYAYDYDSDGQKVYLGPEDVYSLGEDVTEVLGIQKWEPEISAQLSGEVKGAFPSEFPKTDQERIQNLSEQLVSWQEKGLTFTVEEKLEGSSQTCFQLDGEFGVAGRNWNLKDTEDNTLWAVAKQLDVESRIKLKWGDQNIAIQGELIGPAIQKNIYKLRKPTWIVFDIVDDQHKYYSPKEKREIIKELGLQTVPLIEEAFSLEGHTAESLLKVAEGKSMLNPNQEREGLVFKCNEIPNLTFKAISNKYLLKNQD